MKIFFSVLFATLFLFISSCGREKSAALPRPNIILCMADDLGWGDVAYNGHPYIQTPNLDEMAESGIRFDRFYAGSSVCSPTRGSCLTGRNPFRYGIQTANKGHLKKEEVNLAQVMKELGYTTGHFGKWHLGTLSPDFSGKGPGRKPEENYMTPGMAGFDEWFSTEFAVSTYDPYSKESAHTKAWSEKGDWRALYWHNGNPLGKEEKGCDSRIIMDKAIPFIESSVKAGTPFFAVIWFHAPHAPVVGHPQYMKELYSERPEDEQHFFSVVTALDVQIGRLRKELRELGVENNTLLCFTSDNGPEGNPGKIGRHQGSAGDFRGRKRSLYEGGIRVPGIIEFPSRFEGGQVISTPFVTSDYFPTIVDLLGYELEDKDRPYDGISMLPFLEDGKKQRGRAIGFQWGAQRAWTGDRYKLVQNLSEERPKSDNGSVPVEAFELYDLTEDPGEKANIASRHPDILEQMKKELAAFVKSCDNSLAGADYPEKLILVSGVDPQHPYLQKQIQFLEEVFASLNYDLEVQQYQSAHCLELSNSGRVDGELWRIEGIDAAYENLIRVTVPLWSHPELAFVMGDIELDGWESLSPYRVAFRAGTKVVENNIREIVENQLAVASIDEAFGLLVKGDVDVVISDNIVGSVLLKSDKYRDSGIREIPEPLDQALLYTYLHKKHQELVPELARSLRKAMSDGTYQRIVGDPPV